MPLRRVAVMGMSGAGKSTLAVELGRALGAPVFHLDAIYWKPGWVASSWDEFREAHRELIGMDRWVIDGNYSTGGLAERLFLRWVWDWERNHPDFVETVRRQAAGKPVVEVRSRRDARRLVEDARRGP